MHSKIKRFSDSFDRLATFWSSSRAVQLIYSILGTIWQSCLITISIIVVIGFLIIGILGGYFAKVVSTQPVLSYKVLYKDITDYSESSESYFAGNVPIGKLNSELIRTKADLKDISPNMIHAVVAIEDELYYQHHGVVPKAVIRASLEELLNQPQATGGSSITQQLVKNQILTSEISINRKFKEIMLALRLEKYFTKGEIMTSYLNMAPFGRDAGGRNVAGIGAAAEGIFNVKASKLNIPQAAFLAGLPKNPFEYTPFKNQGGQKSNVSAGIGRAHLVLHRMYAAGYIDKKQLTEALNYDYSKHFAKPKKGINTDYPYLQREVEKRAELILAKQAAKREGGNADRIYKNYLNYRNVVYERDNNVYKNKKLSLQDIAKRDGYNYAVIQSDHERLTKLIENARLDLQNHGYKIYTTVNKSIYDDMQTFARGYSGYSPDKRKTLNNGKTIDDPMQVGSILIENKSGKIISFVGGRGYDKLEYNFATDVPRQNGSTMKPLLVYAPAMELGLIQPGSIVADLPYKRVVNGNQYEPSDYGSTATNKLFHGFETVRDALAASHNVPAVDTFTRLSGVTNRAPDYLKKMGITSLVGSDGHNVSAALGGITKGITVEENTNAYTTFANNGKFVDAYMIGKIVDGHGNTVYKHQEQPVTVFSPQTNYLMLDMMRDVLKRGTGAALPGLLEFHSDLIGKTGTSQDWRDSWLVASNPNMTLGVWNGYARNDQLNRYTYSTQTRQLWAGLANRAYHNDPELMATATRFTQPSGVVKTSICGLTDGKPTKMCQAAGFVKTDLVNTKYLPTQATEALEAVTGGYRIRASVMQSRFPYIDLKSANPKLLGKIKP